MLAFLGNFNGRIVRTKKGSSSNGRQEISSRLIGRNGIVNNTKLQPNRLSPDWYWYRKNVKATPLYEVAHDHGMTTAAFYGR